MPEWVRSNSLSGPSRVVWRTSSGNSVGGTASPRDGLTVEAEWTMAEVPHRVGRIDLGIHLPHRISAEQKERLLKVAHGCTVHQSLAVPAGVAIELNPHPRAEKPS